MERELNRKLVEWAGFTRGKEYGWNFPDNSWQRFLPYFDESLDACFKWLVPKLYYVKIIANVAPSGDVFWNGSVGLEYSKAVTVTSESPALALCLAIGKLIDGETIRKVA